MHTVNGSDGRPLTAEHVQRLGLLEQLTLRGTLRCRSEECQGDAWFVSTNRKQKAHFSGHHQVGCEEAAHQRATVEAALPEVDTPLRHALGVRITIFDDAAGDAGVEVVHNADAAPSTGHAYRRRLTDDVVERPQQRRLHPLALDLLRDPTLAARDIPISFGSLHSTFREFFVHLTQVSDEHVGQLRGYWGRIDTITPGKAPETHFVNSHGTHAQNVQLRGGARATVLEQNRDRALHDGGILVIGTPTTSANGYRLLPVTDASLIAVVRASALA